MLRCRAASVCASFVILSMLGDAVHAEPSSLWDHNNSLMGLYADGAARVFRYQNPRRAMKKEGVQPGTLLFQGQKSGANYSGTAFVFSRRCGAIPYPVNGTASNDERQITLYGRAPSGLDSDCRPIAYRQDVLEFSFLEAGTPPPAIMSSQQLSSEASARLAEIRKQEEQADRFRRERVAEEQRLAELRAFLTAQSGCARLDLAACQIALASPQATAGDRTRVLAWRASALDFETYRTACQTGSVGACEAALASPALIAGQRQLLERWRDEASPRHRAGALLSEAAGSIQSVTATIVTSLRNLPVSTRIASAIAVVLAVSLAVMMHRARHGTHTQPSTAPAFAAPVPEPRAWLSPELQPSSSDTAMVNPSAAVPVAMPPPIPTNLRDTPAAFAAMELALGYLEEVRAAERPAVDDEIGRKHQLNTLSLASKQLEKAEKLDPDAVLKAADADAAFRVSINELKAEALFLEGTVHQAYDLRRAIPALVKSTALNPNDPRAFFVLGLTHAANHNKRHAIEALTRAVALDPGNLKYRLELDRAQNLSASEVAAYKVTRGAEHVFDAGVGVANAGILLWNIFAVTWNVLTFPIRLVLRIAEGPRR